MEPIPLPAYAVVCCRLIRRSRSLPLQMPRGGYTERNTHLQLRGELFSLLHAAHGPRGLRFSLQFLTSRPSVASALPQTGERCYEEVIGVVRHVVSPSASLLLHLRPQAWLCPFDDPSRSVPPSPAGSSACSIARACSSSAARGSSPRCPHGSSPYSTPPPRHRRPFYRHSPSNVAILCPFCSLTHPAPAPAFALSLFPQSAIADLHFPSTVLSVRLNRERLVVVLERRVVVHALSTLQARLRTASPGPLKQAIVQLPCVSEMPHFFQALVCVEWRKC